MARSPDTAPGGHTETGARSRGRAGDTPGPRTAASAAAAAAFVAVAFSLLLSRAAPPPPGVRTVGVARAAEDGGRRGGIPAGGGGGVFVKAGREGGTVVLGAVGSAEVTPDGVVKIGAVGGDGGVAAGSAGAAGGGSDAVGAPSASRDNGGEGSAAVGGEAGAEGGTERPRREEEGRGAEVSPDPIVVMGERVPPDEVSVRGAQLPEAASVGRVDFFRVDASGAEPKKKEGAEEATGDEKAPFTTGKESLLGHISKAAKRGDVKALKSHVDAVLKSQEPAFMWKAASELYGNLEPKILAVRLQLLREAYELAHGHKTAVVQRNGKMQMRLHGDSDKRRASQMLGLALEDQGRDEEAKEVYDKAVKLGLWKLWDQRPQHFFDFIKPGKPFPDSSTYAGDVKMLESSYDAILEEISAHQHFPGNLKLDGEKLAVEGKWLQAPFLHQGEWDEHHVRLFPVTAKAVREVSETFGHRLPDAVVQMSTLAPGTRVRPHCGSGNHKVRLHLPLYVPPEGCGIKIANETNVWTPGRVLVVDDSYVHEVWNEADRPRTVLIVDVWAAGMGEKDKERVREYFGKRRKSWLQATQH